MSDLKVVKTDLAFRRREYTFLGEVPAGAVRDFDIKVDQIFRGQKIVDVAPLDDCELQPWVQDKRQLPFEDFIRGASCKSSTFLFDVAQPGERMRIRVRNLTSKPINFSATIQGTEIS